MAPYVMSSKRVCDSLQNKQAPGSISIWLLLNYISRGNAFNIRLGDLILMQIGIFTLGDKIGKRTQEKPTVFKDYSRVVWTIVFGRNTHGSHGRTVITDIRGAFSFSSVF